jgi:hypothetical protein
MSESCAGFTHGGDGERLTITPRERIVLKRVEVLLRKFGCSDRIRPSGQLNIQQLRLAMVSQSPDSEKVALNIGKRRFPLN